MVKDLVCSMEVDSKTAAWKSEYQGETYYFCCNGCKNTFDRDPQKFIKGPHNPHLGHHH